MKSTMTLFLAAMLLAACGHNNDNKPMMQKEHDTLEKAKGVDSMIQQQAQQQKQETDKQTQ
jgi:hypothetical protein